jgi:hypothetical protein
VILTLKLLMIADELFKAKDLSSYATTTEAMRQHMTQQAEDNYYKQEETTK